MHDGPTMLLAAGGHELSSGLVAVAAVAVLGVGTQWVAWRLKVPSILLLLIAGILAGPVARALLPEGSPFALDPNALVRSDLLLALVGVSVGLILYEGGLTLRFREIRAIKRGVVALVTVGAAVTWAVAATAAALFFALPIRVAVLLGAILVVTGPTVIIPMLAHIRPAGPTGPVLKWEGIVIDPIGVLLAVLVFEWILATGRGADAPILGTIARTVVVGGGLGAAGAGVMLLLMRRFLVPDFLLNPVSLMTAVAVYALADIGQAESGLLATVVMGMVLANQKREDIRHILEFKESLRVLLIGALFIVLAARVPMADLRAIDLGAVAGFIVVLVLVARPLAVWVSTIGAGLTTNERLFLACVAPRGVVATAAASIFAIGLENADPPVPGAEQIAPIVFAVVIGTVALYGLTAGPLAKALGIADQNPQGIAFIGAPAWVRSLAALLGKRGVRVLLIDTNHVNIRAARMQSIDAVHANVLDEGVLDDLDLRGIGRAFAATPNEEVNTLALQRFAHRLEKSGLYRLPAAPSKPARKGQTGPPSGSPSTAGTSTSSSGVPIPLRKGDSRTGPRPAEPPAPPPAVGRRAFDRRADFASLEHHVAAGWVVKATGLSDEFTYADFKTLYGGAAIPLLALSGSSVVIGTVERPVAPAPGDTIVALVDPDQLLIPGGPPESAPA